MAKGLFEWIFLYPQMIFFNNLLFYVNFIMLQIKMAVPPTYADLGKSTRDLFSKGYSMYNHFFLI